MIIPYSCPDCKAEIRGNYTESSHKAECPDCGKTSTIPFDEIKPGMILGTGYRIERKLDELSKSKVFLAYQESMDRHVQLKILPPDLSEDEEEFQRFKREIKLTATLNHAHILAAFGAGEDAGIHFLIRQHKAGETLEEYCLRQGKMPEKDLLRLLLPVADALKTAWNEEKILHRNLKPENILLTDDDTAMLADLGIAKSVISKDVDITGQGFIVGTPEYMSPEQVQGQGDVDCRSDIYSFCIMLYRMSTGEVPFEDPSPVVVMQKHMNETPIPAQFKNNELSTTFSRLLDKGLKKDKTDRFDDWESFIEEMKAVLKGGDTKEAGGKKPESSEKKAADEKKKEPSADKKKNAGGGTGKKQSGGKQQKQAGVRREDVERIAQQMYAAKAKRSKVVLYILSSLIPLLILGGFLFVQQTQRNTQKRVNTLIQQAKNYERQKDYISAVQSLTKAQVYLEPESKEWKDAQQRIQVLKAKINARPAP